MSEAAPPPTDVWAIWSRRLENALAAIAVVMLTSPFLLLLGVSEDPAAPENPAFRVYWLPPYAIILGLSAWRARALTRCWAPLLMMVVVVGWAYATKSWSIDPETTGRRVLALALTTLFGVYLGAAFDPQRLVRLIAGCFLFLAVSSLVLVFLAPRFGVDHLNNGGDWRGAWAEKNTLALFMTLGAVAAVSAAFLGRKGRWMWLAMLALCALLLVMSRGKTALLCFGVSLVAAGIIWLMRRGRLAALATLWVTITTGAVAGFILWQSPAAVLAAVGKDPTLTGRTDIWRSVMAQVAEHPWLGFGFAAFWEDDSIPAKIVRKQTGWTVPTAHNGWIDLLVQVGWIGVGLLVVVFAVNIIANLARSVRSNDYFAVLFLLIFAMFSMTESFLEQHNSLFWTLFAAVLTSALDRPVRARPAVFSATASAGTTAVRHAPG